MNISLISLKRGPNPDWVKLLPAPFNSYEPAHTLGELEQLAPCMCYFFARHCLVDSVVYGDGRHGFGIRLIEGRWKFLFCDAVNGVALTGNQIDAALLTKSI